MALLDTFNERLKDAMKAKDADALRVLRMVKTRFQQKKTEPGFVGEVTDDVAREVIGSYVKQMTRALEDFDKAGGADSAKAQEIRFEIDYLQEFLPRLLDEAATRELVRKIVVEQGLTQPGQAGRVVGALMKTHKGQVDAALVKKLAEDVLAG